MPVAESLLLSREWLRLGSDTGSLRACHSLSLVVMLAQVLSGPARACHGPARPAVIWQLYHLPD